MPRARVPNASFIASAELPFLPFLAPRVFESPISRGREQHNAKNKKPQKENAELGEDEFRLRGSQAEPTLKAWVEPQHTSSGRRDDNAAGGLLRTSHAGRRTPSSNFAPTSVERRYADISLLARHSVRYYRTTRDQPHVTTIRRVKPPSAIAARKPSILYQSGPRLAARREEALAVVRARLENHVAHELNPTRSRLMNQGQYRSFRRRITNLEHWNDTHVNLHRRFGGSRNRFVMTRALAALDRSLYPGIGQYTRKIKIEHDPICARWSTRIFPLGAKQDLQQTWENWFGLDIQERQSAYKRLLVYLLHRKPARAMQFIQVLASDRLLRNRKVEVIADALGHLAKLHSRGVYDARHEWGPDKRVVKRQFVSDFVYVFHQVLAARRKVCSQDLLYNLVNIAEAKDLQKVFTCLDDNRTHLGFDTVLHYANTFAKAGDIEFALRCLDVLRKMSSSTSWESVVDRERLRWTCALILRKSMSKKQEYHETPTIVASIVRLGVKMDILLYNIVMHNALEAHDYATAFKVYNALDGNGLEADKHTYSILLHGCTMQSNPAMFSQFAEHCADVAENTRDPWLATDYLYYLYVRHQEQSDKAQASALLHDAYPRFFSNRPVELLRNRVRRTLSVLSASTDVAKFDPPPMALYIMYQAQIQEALDGGTQQVLDMYTRFRYLVQERTNGALTRLASDAIIWNAFMLAFCQKQQFASASQLIKDMTDGAPQPNIYTWNIFMQAFFKTGQVHAAERVFELLRSRGVDPDQYTYGVLLRGYAKAQHVERIGEIMQHLDADQEMEPDLLRALAGVTQREQLMLILEKSRAHKETEAQEKAWIEDEEEERIWNVLRPGDDAFHTNVTDIADPRDTEDLHSVSKQTTGLGADALIDSNVQTRRAESTMAPELAMEADSIIITDSVEESELVSEIGSTMRQEPISESRPTDALVPLVEQVPVVEPLPLVDPLPVVESVPIVEPGSLVETEPVIEPVAVVNPEPVVATESAVDSEPVIDSKPSVARASPIRPKPAVKKPPPIKKVPIPTTKRVTKAKSSPTKSTPKHLKPVPQISAENPLDPEVQYRKLQEKLGILAPSSPSPTTPAQPDTSFGADYGYKSATSTSISKRLPEFTVRKMYQSSKKRGDE